MKILDRTAWERVRVGVGQVLKIDIYVYVEIGVGVGFFGVGLFGGGEAGVGVGVGGWEMVFTVVAVVVSQVGGRGRGWANFVGFCRFVVSQ